MKKLLVSIQLLIAPAWCIAANIAYIHGDVSECGTTPSANETGLKKNGQACSTSPYDQMLLQDSGSRGLSQFVTLVSSEGHTIESFYDLDSQNTKLDSQWFSDKDVVIFGLHQRLWNTAQKQALDDWLREGGGVLIYSDSASGGFFQEVGAQNPVGQNVTNNLIEVYGMQVTVDQADGITAQQANSSVSIPGVSNLQLEGEGVSPVAISLSNTDVEVLIPYTRNVSKMQGLSIRNPEFASLAMREVGAGHVVVMFDRQPMWNSGPGSDINQKNNRDILRNVINFLAARSDPPIPPRPPGAMSAIYLLMDDEQP